MSVAGDVVKTLQARLTEIEERLDPLVKEADELREALRRLLGNERQASAGRRRTRASTGTAARRGRPRAPRGRTRDAILEAIKSEPKTAGQIARETGLNRGTISTTLTKLTRKARRSRPSVATARRDACRGRGRQPDSDRGRNSIATCA